MVKRRRKYKLKKKVKRFFWFLVLLCVGITLINSCVKNNKKEKTDDEMIETLLEKKTYLNKINNESNKDVKEEWKNAITNYLDLYYKSMINLETKDVTKVFDNPKGEEAYLAQNAIDLLVKHHKMQFNDMRLIKANYNLLFSNIEETSEGIKIDVLVDENVTFKFIPDVKSKAIDVENIFVIDKKGKIKSIRVVQGYYVMFTNEMETISKSEIDKLKKEYISLMKEELEDLKFDKEDASNVKYKTDITCDGKYNRKAAVAYNYKYLEKRNPEYTAYDQVGGNCQNLVSQSLHAGGLPMDNTGYHQWKYYGSDLDTTDTKTGRSASWTGTANFYDYVIGNTDAGICADADINIFYAEPGDVGHVGYKGYTHSVLVVKKILDKDGKVTDLLVNSNTTSLKDYPFLAYPYQNKRIIKILGYNN